MRQQMLCALVLFVGLSAHAAVDYPGTSGDLMDESSTGWNGAVPTDAINFTKGGTYYTSKSGTLGGLVISTKGKITFDQTKSPVANPLVTMAGHFNINGDGRNVTFIGGKYDFQGLYTLARGDYDINKNNNMTFDGCVFTNVANQLAMTYNGTTLTTWTLLNNAVLHTKGDLKPDYFGNGKTHLVVSGGSQVLAEGILQMGARSTGNQGILDQKILVSGEGSLVKFGKRDAASYVSMMFSESLLEASAGGSIVHSSNKELVIGSADTASNNVVRATGSGSSASLGTVCFAYTGNAHHNRIEALDDATVGITYLNVKSGEGNGIVCSNATVNINNFAQGTATKAYVHVSGDHPRVTLTSASATQMNFKNGFRFVIDLPLGGYAYNDPSDCPIKSLANFEDSLDETTELEINGIEAYMKDMVKRGVRKERIKLAYLNANAYWGQLTGTYLERWNAKLPKGAVLSSPNVASAEDRGRTLYLDLTAPFGLLVVFR